VPTCGAAAQVGRALLVLAAVYRAARELFPLETSPQAVERTVVIRIDALKVLTPMEISARGFWFLRQTSQDDAVAEHIPLGQADSITGGASIEIPDMQLVEPACAGGGDLPRLALGNAGGSTTTTPTRKSC